MLTRFAAYLAAMLILASCNFTGGKSLFGRSSEAEDSVEVDTEVIDVPEDEAAEAGSEVAPGSEVAEGDISALEVYGELFRNILSGVSESKESEKEEGEGLLEGVLDGLKKFGDKAAEKGWIDTTKAPEPEATPAAKEPELRDIGTPQWYDRDFALKGVSYTYGFNLALVATYTNTITRIGNKFWWKAQIKMNGMTMTVMAAEEVSGSHMKVTWYRMGQKSKVYEKDYPENTDAYILHKEIRALISNQSGSSDNETGFFMLDSHPPVSQAVREVTISGRPAAVVVRKETMSMPKEMGGIESKSEITFYVDKEYDFIYKRVSSSSGLVNVKNQVNFDITYFTDHPTEKDIPRP